MLVSMSPVLCICACLRRLVSSAGSSLWRLQRKPGGDETDLSHGGGAGERARVRLSISIHSLLAVLYVTSELLEVKFSLTQRGRLCAFVVDGV